MADMNTPHQDQTQTSETGSTASLAPPDQPAVKPVCGPVKQTERIQSLDVLRGFALLGILVMNIQAFSMIFAAYFNPYAYGDLQGVNYVVWLLSHILADRKFMTIFSMLFGAGIALMTSRREAATGRSAGLHYRRMAVLLLLGLIHAYLIWDGDILVTYAICGMVVFPFRRWRPRNLILGAIILIALGSGIAIFSQVTMPHWPAEAVQDLKYDDWLPPEEQIDATLEAHRGSWLGLLPIRAGNAFVLQTFVLLFENLWRVSGLMLAGMALYKMGVFSAAKSNKTYLAMVLLALIIGLPLIVGGVLYRNSVLWNVRYSFFYGGQYNYWGSLIVAMGWVGLIVLMCRTEVLTPLRQALAAVGQMAFTNYLMQSVICTLLFNGYGLGLYGKVDRIGQVGVVLAVWAIQLIISPLWLRRYRFGPAEWLWRSMTYGKMQQFRR